MLLLLRLLEGAVGVEPRRLRLVHRLLFLVESQWAEELGMEFPGLT